MNYPSDYGRVAINLTREEKKYLVKFSEENGHTLTWTVKQALKNYYQQNAFNISKTTKKGNK